MALIKCPECGREVSDKASKCVQCGHEFIHQEKRFCSECGTEIPVGVMECPNCGCPVETQATLAGQATSVEMQPKKQNINIKKLLPLIIGIIAVFVIGMIVYNVKVIQPKKIEAQNKATYDEAIGLLEKGKYEDSSELLQSIVGYNDVDVILEQIKYESYAYSAINDLKKYLKNPDSYQPYEITFYASMGDETDTENTDESQSAEIEEETYPVCVMHYGAQNGFGGNTTGYAICSYDSEVKEYKLLGTCDSLDENDYDKDDKDDAVDLIICAIINLYRDGGDTVGSVDLARLKTVLKNDAYSTIKIIE